MTAPAKKIPAILQKPGPIPKADKEALNNRMAELGKRQRPAKKQPKGKSRGR